MKAWKKKGRYLLTAAAVTLVTLAAVKETMAYFTTYVEAQGGYPVTLGSETEIKEHVKDTSKYIQVVNTGETDCYVRVRVYFGNLFQTEYLPSEGWELAKDGYWYYREFLSPGEETTQLIAAVTVPEEAGEEFHVIVVQEHTMVRYDESGQPYADWEADVDTTTDIGVAAGEEETL